MALDVIRGVNLGGWFVTEKWITPSIYQSNTQDEWTLCSVLGKESCSAVLSEHWGSFFTKDDFEEIKQAGLNAVRIPIGYWAVDVLPSEPYVSGQYPYLIQAVTWAQDLNLSVLLDVHGAPGSQNGQDNSGRIGRVGIADNGTNWDRTEGVLRNLTMEFGAGRYGGVVKSIELLNEPRLGQGNFTMDTLKGYYESGSQVVQSGDSAMGVTVHDAFWGPTYWTDFDPSNPFGRGTSTPNYLHLDTHQYYAFAPVNNLTRTQILQSICNVSQILKSPQQESGIPGTVVGEWSLETTSSPATGEEQTDGVLGSSSGERETDQERRTWFRLLFEAQARAYEPESGQVGVQVGKGWYYWTWKTEYDINTWSYRRGISDGYIPSDVSNSSTFVYPVLDNGCVDAGFNYTAPRRAGSSSGTVGRKSSQWAWGLVLSSIGLYVLGSI